MKFSESELKALNTQTYWMNKCLQLEQDKAALKIITKKAINHIEKESGYEDEDDFICFLLDEVGITVEEYNKLYE